ncbi:MAG TPA: acyl-CoA dehydrogenase family protein [Ktedonobacteraceae bacterium]|nr:acyl-CoA dehydrogenase family protein [Ktedonobacteraceae bacterium]
MPNFAPTEEQEEIRSLARSLAVEQLRAQGRASEKQGDISPALADTLAQTGLTAPFPEQLGGSGAIEAMTYTLIAEELGYGDGALAINIIGSLMGPLAVLLAGGAGQQQTYITPFCDTRTGPVQRGSFAYAERTGGYTLADVTASVRKEGDAYIVNGAKRDVIHGTNSSPRVALLRLEGTSGLDGLCALMVPAQGEGITLRNDTLKLGLTAAPSASFDFVNAQVMASCMLGQPGDRGVIRAATLYNILRAGVACGMARAALEYARDYAKDRIAFGRPIASYQGIAFMVAEMAMNLDAARLLVWRAAVEWDGDTALETLVHDAEAAQHQAVKIAKSATIDGIQILGGAGFIQDHPVEMWARNAAAME